MGRKRRGRPLDGVLVLDKPAGPTSNRVLQQAKALYRAAKAGHTGSLDPLATGVLPLCFGHATKVSQYLLDADKAYEADLVFGIRTASGDADGEVLEERDASALSEAQVRAALDAFRGPIKQVPSMFSAIKRDGQPLYKLARQGKEVEREARAVTVHELDLLSFEPGGRARCRLRIRCSKGTYVRSIAEDLGAALGCGGHVVALRRTAAGPYTLVDAVSLDALAALRDSGGLAALDALLQPAQSALENYPLVQLSESSGFYLRQGQAVLVPNAPRDGMVRVALESGEFLGMGEILDDGRVAPRRLMVAGR